MGWQDRDWAKFDDGELGELYGVVRPDPKLNRIKVWGVMAVLALVTGGFAYTQLPPTSPRVAPVASPDVIFGMRGTDASVSAMDPGGLSTVCSNEVFDSARRRWVCVTWILNVRGLPVIEPPPYRGPCTHLIAAEDQAMWRCLGADPVPPSDVPPVSIEPGTGLFA